MRGVALDPVRESAVGGVQLAYPQLLWKTLCATWRAAHRGLGVTGMNNN